MEYGIWNMVRDCVPIPQKLYNKTRGLKTPKEIEQYFPGFIAFIDSTEQQIPRPAVDKDGRKMYYSGKKKRYTLKNQIMVNNCGYILHKFAHRKGKRPDYIFKNTKRITLSLPKRLLS